MRSQRRTIRYLIRLFIIAVLIAASAWAVFYFAPEQALENAVESRVNAWLRDELGAAAHIGRVDVGLHEIVLAGVELPLGAAGHCRIERAAIDVELLNLVRRPGQWERVVRNVDISGVKLNIALPESGVPQSPDAPWLPRIRIPDALYAGIARFDSLAALTVGEVQIVLRRADAEPFELWQFNGGILQDNRGTFHLAAQGPLFGDTALTASLEGTLDPLHRGGHLLLECGVPPGGLPAALYDAPALTVDGGRIALEILARDTVAIVRGRAAAPRLSVQTAAGEVTARDLVVTLERDTLRVDSCAVAWGDLHTDCSGYLALRGDGPLVANSHVAIPDLTALDFVRRAALPVSGGLSCRAELGGNLRAPVVRLEVDSSRLALLGQPVRDLNLAVEFAAGSFDVNRCSFTFGRGCAEANGRIRWSSPPVLDLYGRFELESPPVILGWKSELRDIQIAATGTPARPRVTALFRSDSATLASCAAAPADSGWTMDIRPATGATGQIHLTAYGDALHIHASNAQAAAVLLSRAWYAALESVRDTDLRFRGNTRAGELSLTASLDTAAADIGARLMQNVRFVGAFERPRVGAVNLRGRWSGSSARGTPFEGRADVAVADRVITIEHIYIDAVGAATGSVDLGRGVLNIDVDVSELPIPELPLHPSLIRSTGIQGTISGFIAVRDSIRRPRWESSMAMINGEVFGLPGYWMNLEVAGEGPAANVRQFELGRGTRKILEAAGLVDVRRRQIAITTEIGAARAEDFVFALTGRQRYLSGELDGRGAVSGDLLRPDIEAELTVRDGKLFDEIHVDELAAELRSTVGANGVRTVQMPHVRFGKHGTYDFRGTAAFAAIAGGALRASVTAHGDFLDLLDQVDRTFVSRGSASTLRAEFGGTIDRPELRDGELVVANGQFSYVDATPEPVAAEVYMRWSPGQLDTARIYFAAGNQWLQIRSLPVCDSPASPLRPLIVPTPRVCLGVLEATTGDAGMPLHLPGLMKADWTGIFTLGPIGGRPLTISATADNRWLLGGDVAIRGSRVTFPFLGGAGPARPVARWLLGQLEAGVWNMDVAVGPGNHYDVEITGLRDSEMYSRLRTSLFFESLADYVDHLTVDAFIDPADAPLLIRGTIQDTSFYLSGRLTSSRGRVEYLDQTFRVDYAVVEFDETNVMPVLEGRAVTTGIDSIGRQVPVYLTMYQIDRETGTRSRRGRFDQATFVLEGESGQTPEQVLAYLGYDAAAFTEKAQRVAAATVVRMLGRQWLDPLERRLERWTWLDEVALKPGGGRTGSLLRQQDYAVRDTLLQTSTVRFLSGSHVTVGKYITRDLFVTYTGELAEGQFELGNRLGLVHLWNLEYRMQPLSPDLVLDFAVEYDEIQRRRDEAILLKYSFPLELEE